MQMVPAEEQKISLLNTRFTNIDKQQLLNHTVQWCKERRQATLVFLNVDVVMKLEKDAELRRIVEKAEFALADGMPLIWISHLFGKPLKEKISGSDFVPELCNRAAREGLKLFLLGGAGDTAQKAKEALEKKFPKIRIVGTYSPPFGFEKNPQEAEAMNEAVYHAHPDILIVCLGCPKQEKYIAANREKYGVPISICAGATIDFLAGNVKRCPGWMSRCGLEWFYRFTREPKRLFRRYFIDDIQILRLILKYRD